MTYTIYDHSTGQIIGYVHAETQPDADLNLKNCTHVLGQWDADTYYIDNGQAVAKPPRPQDGNHYQFNYATKQWNMLTQVVTPEQVRNYRNALLSDIDRVNPVWYNSLSDQQQQELQQYRLALLAVPEQEGFPESVAWPAKPAWL